jgi:hypothetical protein
LFDLDTASTSFTLVVWWNGLKNRW